MPDPIDQGYAPLSKSGRPIEPPHYRPYKPTAEDVLEAAGPLGEAGTVVGEALRTGRVDPRDIAPAMAGVMVGAAGPEGEGAAAGTAAAKVASRAVKAAKRALKAEGESALAAPELLHVHNMPVLYGDPRLRGSMSPFEDMPLTFNGKQPKDWTPGEFKEVGDIAGIPNLGPDTPPIGFQYEDGSTFHIPGGTEGTFTYYDLLSMKAQGIDPSRIPQALHAQIQQKLLRTMTPAELTTQHVWDGLVFGLTSPNNPLFPNQLAQSRVRWRDPAMIDQLAEMIPWKAGEKVDPKLRAEYDAKVAAALGIQGAPLGGLGVRGSQATSRIAELAQMFKQNPDFFRKTPNEGWDQFAERIASQVGGMQMKTASFGSVWQDPGTAAVSAIDRHMANIFERQGGLFKDETERMGWELRAVNRWNKEHPERPVENFYQMRNTPGTDGHIGKMLLEYVGTTKDPKFRYAGGEINPNIPPHLAQAQWAVEPQQVQIMGEAYRRALEMNNQLAKENGLNLFGSQWMFWDRQRRRLEPHENMFPGLERMPAMSKEQLGDVSKEHAASGHKTYTKYDPATGKQMREMTEEEAAGVDYRLAPTKARPSAARFGYFALPLAGAGAADIMLQPGSGGEGGPL